MPLTTEQVLIIKSTVPVLQEYGKEITSRFYENMLADVPELNDVFNHTNQVNGHQASALAGSLYAYAANINDLGVLSPTVERICQKHASLYVKPEQYEIVGCYLLKAMNQILGDAFTLSIHEAWAEAYQQLAHVMMKREDQLHHGRPDWTDWREFRISQRVQESSEIASFYLTPVDQKPLPSYLPGQYVSIRTTVPNLDHVQARQYSLSDAPRSDYYRISVKKETGLSSNNSDSKAHPGWISNVLHNDKKVGDVIQVSHPAGEFFLDPRGDSKSSGPAVLISAGVGLTPDLSILNTLVSKESKRKISWVHATRNSQAHAFKQHVLETSKDYKNIQVHVFNKDPGDEDRKGVDYQFKGRMSLNKLDTDHDLFIHDRTTEYYVCGPDKFMMDVGNTLSGWGVDRKRIKVEVFGAGELPTN